MDGLQHTGRFFLLSNGKHAGEELRQALVGRNIFVKYDDQKPEVALLVEDEIAGKRVHTGTRVHISLRTTSVALLLR